MTDETARTTSRKWTHWVRRSLAGLMILLLFGAVAFGFRRYRLLDAVESVERKTYDFRQSLRIGKPIRTPSSDILIVKFDNRTLNAFGAEFGTWPWPRRVHADMIEFLSQDGVRALVYDMVFTAPQLGMAQSDQAFADAFRRFDNVYLIMNFDHEYRALQRIGRDFTFERDVRRVEPLAIPLRSELGLRSPGRLDLGLDGFYRNHAMTFDHYQPLLPQLLDVGKRIGFANHAADADGISRRNPLFHRLQYHTSLRTDARPVAKDPATGKWADARGRPVTEDGLLLDENGMTRKDESLPRYQFFPHMALRLLLDIEYDRSLSDLALTADGHLVFGRHRVPLDRQGNFLINWYNTSVAVDYYSQRLEDLRRLENDAPPAGMPDGDVQTRKRQIGQAMQECRDALEAPYTPMPYTEVSALEVIEAMREWQSGRMSSHARDIADEFRDKIVFVAGTATATFDTKFTPIHRHGTYGAIVLATMFDNLRQNTAYVRRAGDTTNLAVTLVVCGLTAFVVWRVRSAAAGASLALAAAAIYSVAAIVVFRSLSLWINMALPVAALTLTTSVTFIAKYVGSDKAYRHAYRLATTDVMTGLYNHRYFQEQMLRSIAVAARNGHKFSLIMLDVDHFKKFNDTYGHQAGDEVLRCVARKIKSSVREADVPARYGGEEMAVIADRADERQGLEAAEKLVRAIAATAYPISRGVTKNVTVSAGVATYPTDGTTPSDLIACADAGLYRAKQNGRNQVGARP
jgi:diguanylate cyclase (GGDEF)-like protein